MNKVAVLGSAGFIGSNLTEGLLRLGYDVLGVDNFATGDEALVSSDRYSKLSGLFTFREQSILNTPEMEKLLKDRDTVFLLAALPRVSFSIDHPFEANDTNVNGVLSVLEASRAVGVKRIVFSSSSSLYGGVAEFPTKETATPSPKSPYALHKLTGEHYGRLYSELHGVDFCSLRYFNVFGPQQKTGAKSAYATVIPAFFSAAVNNNMCRVDGSGDQSRDFCYVDNVVQANILAGQHQQNLDGEAFNIACGDTFSVNDVYNAICEFSGSTIPKLKAPARLGDPMKSHADITKAIKILGYKPLVKFEEGMERTWKWWKLGCKTEVSE